MIDNGLFARFLTWWDGSLVESAYSHCVQHDSSREKSTSPNVFARGFDPWHQSSLLTVYCLSLEQIYRFLGELFTPNTLCRPKSVIPAHRAQGKYGTMLQ